ncbi:MAG: hypothetical protein ABI440_06020 [Casimicrobiaceae bacterium]
MNEVIVVFNAGSTSLKFAAYALGPATTLSPFRVGRVDSMHGDPHFIVKDAAGKTRDTALWNATPQMLAAG